MVWVVSLAVLLGAPTLSYAANRTWEGSSTAYNTSGSWFENAVPGASDVAVFDSTHTGTNNPSLSSSSSVSGLSFVNGTRAWTFTGTSGGSTEVLTIGTSGIVSNDDSTQTFSSNMGITLGSSASFTSNSTGALNFTSSLSSFNIGTTTLTLNGTSTSASNIMGEAIANTAGNVIKDGSGLWTMTANHNFTGALTLRAGTLSISNLANGGSASHLGAGSTSASNLVFDGGTLRHTLNNTDSTNRNFTINTDKTAVFDISDASGNITLSGASAATNGALTKIGAGTLTLSGNNAHTGATNVGTAGGASGGTLTLGNNERIANSSTVNVYAGTFNVNSRTETIAGLNLGGGASGTTAAISMTSGTLTLGGNLTYSATNDPNGATITGGTLALGANRVLTIGNSSAATNDLAISSVISGSSFGLDKQGAGTLQLTGTNTYTGVTTFTAGTLSVATIGDGGVAGNLGQATNAASNLVFNGGTLQYTGATASTNRGFTLNNATTGTIDVSTGATNLTISGSTTATTGALTKTGTGTLTLTGTNLHSGTTTISAGTLSVGNGGTTGTLGSGSVVNNAALVVNRSNALTLAGDISGTGSLTQSGAGTTSLTGTNSYAGTTTISAGTLSVGTGGTTGTLGSGSVVNNAALVVNRSNALTLAGDISGTGSLTQSGAGTTTLSGNNTYTGVTTLNAGTLSVATIGNGGVAGNLGQATNAASNLVFNGGSLQYTGATASTDRSFTLNNATTGTIEVTSAATNLTISGSTTATTGALTKTGDGTLTLSGTNLHSGLTTVADGTLKASGNNSLGATTGNITVSAGATLALDGGTNITRSGTLTLNGNGTSGTVGALHAAGGTGTTSQWTGSTTINTASTITAADNLLIIGNGASGQFNTTTMTLNAGVTFHTPNAASVVPTYLPTPSFVMDPTNIMLHSFITGTGGITKTGNGTLSIIRGTNNSPNNFTGDTIITGGTLLVDGPSNKSHLSSPNIFVGNDGSLNNDSVTLLMGQATGSAAGNNIIGVYNAVTNASDSNLTIYEDGLFNMNRGSNGFINLTLQGGHVDGVGSNPLLTLSGALFSKASAQTGLIENNNLGIGSSKLTVDVESGTTSSGVDLRIDSKIQQGVGFTAVAAGVSLEKTDLGKVVLTGANTYGGITDIVGGILNIQNASALGQNSVSFGSTNHGTTVQSGAQLQLQGGITVENETLTLSGTGVSTTGALRNFGGDNTYNGYVFLAADSRINADAGTNLILANPSGLGSAVINGTSAGKNLFVGGDGNTTVKGAIVGNVSNLTKDGNGTLTLAGSNSYVGATAVQAGALKITHNNGLSGTGVTVSAGAALQFAQNEANQDIAAVGIAANIAGTGLSNGGAIQNLTGANSYAGAITLADNSRITAASGSSLTLSGTVTGAGFGLDAGGVGNTTYSGAIGGSGTALTKTDSGTVTLSGTTANTFTGGTSVNDGTLVLNKSGAGLNTATGTGTLTVGNGVGAADSAVVRLDASNQITDTAAVVLAADGRLNLNNFTDTVGSIAGSGEIIMGTGQLIAGGNNSSTLFTGTLHGDSSAILNKEGTGTLTIGSNVNAVAGDFAGTLNLNAGTLAFNVDNAFTGTVNVAVSGGGTTLKLSNADVDINNLNFTGSGSITLDFSGTSTLNVTNLTIAAGVTVNIINWTDATDYFFATNWSSATQDLTGQAPMNYVVFQGWTGNNTKWQSYDDQITPVPEPSTYGAMLVGAMGALLGWRRYRRNKTGASQ